MREISPTFFTKEHNIPFAVRAIMTDLATTTTGVLTTNAAGALISVRSVPFCPNHLVEQGAKKNKATNCGRTPLMMAASDGHLAMVRYLVDRGADIDKANNDGFTPIYFAAVFGYLAVVQCLVGQGADVNKSDVNGFTPLDAAEYKGHVKVAAYLRAAGAK